MKRSFLLFLLICPALLGAQVQNPNPATLRATAPTDPAAAILLAEGYTWGRWGLPVQPDSALFWERRAAEGGNATGQYLLGNRYLRGSGGVKRDLKRALALLNQSADQHHAMALNLLTAVYSDSAMQNLFRSQGELVKFDPVRALTYAERAAKLGDTQGLFFTGRAYWLGIGTARNDSLAHRYLLQAAEDRNYAPAQALLGDIYLTGSPRHPQDIAQAESWYRRAYTNPAATHEDQTLGKVGLFAVEQLYRRVHNLNLRALYLLPYKSGRLSERQ